jgi:hypothetical protein
MRIVTTRTEHFNELLRKYKENPEYAFILITRKGGKRLSIAKNYYQYKLNSVTKKHWKKDQWATYKYMASMAKSIKAKNVVICDCTKNKTIAATLAKVFAVVNPNCKMNRKIQIHLPTFHYIVRLLSYEAVAADMQRMNTIHTTYKHLVTITKRDGNEHNFIFCNVNNDIADQMLKTPVLDYRVHRLSMWEIERLDGLDLVMGRPKLVKYVNAVA